MCDGANGQGVCRVDDKQWWHIIITHFILFICKIFLNIKLLL